MTKEVPTWRRQLAATAEVFEAELVSRGFALGADGWLDGLIPVPSAGGTVEASYRIRLPDTFPFAPPEVALSDTPDELTWHLGPTGTLCLFRTSDNPARPWETVDGLFERVADWVQQDFDGWPNDPGDPDLNRYFRRKKDTLVTYDSTQRSTGRLTVTSKHDLIQVGPSLENRKQRRKRNTRLWLYAVDAGVLARPIWDWATLTELLGDDDQRAIDSLAWDHKGVLLVHYARNGTEGERHAAVALAVAPPKPEYKRTEADRQAHVDPDHPALTVLDLADDAHDARWFRAGPDATRLSKRHVAVIGCGAIGSFTADLLVRAGVGELTLVDGDGLQPGNCVRHLVDRSHVSKTKVDAVRDHLVANELIEADRISTIPENLSVERAAELLLDANLVIDATANAQVGGLLLHLSSQLERVTFLKVSVHRHGGLVRVDRLGPGTSDDRCDYITGLAGTGATYREAGCGDPVSPTPPHAVVHAAATVTRFAVDGFRPEHERSLPDSWVEVLAPQPDEPWQTVGVFT